MPNQIQEKKCAFPNCKNLGASRGVNSITGEKSRWKWCNFHRKKDGKSERLSLNKQP